MIVSKAKNQKTIKDAINDFVKENPNFAVTIVAKEMELTKFVKFLANRMMIRVQNEDCYFIDFLEDIERINE